MRWVEDLQIAEKARAGAYDGSMILSSSINTTHGAFCAEIDHLENILKPKVSLF